MKKMIKKYTGFAFIYNIYGTALGKTVQITTILRKKYITLQSKEINQINSLLSCAILILTISHKDTMTFHSSRVNFR